MSAKHTPGPWEINRSHDKISIMADPDSSKPDTMLGIAEVWSFDGERRASVVEANARLIASAPALLEVATNLRDLADAVAGAYEDDEGTDRLTLSDGTVLTGEAADAMHLLIRTVIGLGDAAQAVLSSLAEGEG